MNIYIAGSFSSYRDRESLQKMIDIVRSEYPEHHVYVPMEFKVKEDFQKEDGTWFLPNRTWAKKVFDNDIAELNKMDLMFVMYTGHKSTTGTSFEIGYAYSREVPIVGYIPDWAKGENMSLMVLNSFSFYLTDAGVIGTVNNEYLSQFNQK